MKTLLMQIHTSDADGETGGIDFALVHIDEELARKILERRKLLLDTKGKDDTLLRIHYSDQNCHFLQMTETTKEILRKYIDEETRLDTTCLSPIPDYTLLVDELSTEDWTKIEEEGTARVIEVDCDEMVVFPNGVYWMAFLTDLDDVRITSGSVDYVLIEQCI